jgi:HEAT repeat protein
MFVKHRIFAVLTIVFVLNVAASAQILEGGLESDWGDFLHYTAIGRLDLARAYGETVIESDPDPVELLKLSEENIAGYQLLLKMHADSDELGEVSGKILDIIEEGRFILRTNPKVIIQEITRLSGTIRGRIAAQKRLANAGEYAIPYMLDALADPSRKSEFPNITSTLPMIGRDAIRPLVAALQTNNVTVKSEIIRALGEIGYRQSLGYLQYIVENDESEEMKDLASRSVSQIDPAARRLTAAELLFQLGDDYYFHSNTLAPAADFEMANIWFWNGNSNKLSRIEVDKGHFNELMSMRACEWALQADEDLGKAIALWIAAFFKAESAGLAQPEYFAAGHANAMTYATTAGPEYLHQSLERALTECNNFVALGVVEALAANAGEKSLLYRVGTDQPLVAAMKYKDKSVRYSAAIALALAGPSSDFTGSELIVENLSAAISETGSEEFAAEKADAYALRAVASMLNLAVSRNTIVDLSEGREALVGATKDSRMQMQLISGQVLAYLQSPDAQRAIATMALNVDNSMDVRTTAFLSLATSAKVNANLLTTDQVDAIYELISSNDTDPQLRAPAAVAYGALNLPSRKVKELILDQSKN